MLRAWKIKRKKVDVKGGKMTFAQRIALGKAIEAKDEYVAMKEIIKALHGIDVKLKDIVRLKDYLTEIVEGIVFWVERENQMLSYEPTSEERQAGVLQLSEKIGYFGTIKALAKNYSREPDEILNWEYGKVFGILYTDLEEYKYQKRYNKVLESKWKK